MNKETFLQELRDGLPGMPQADLEERLSFYGEMIDDRIEEGLSEDEAVACVGPVEEVIAQIAADMPIAKLVKEKVAAKRKLRAWEIVLLVLGFPVWFPLLVAAAVVLLALYLVLWVLILCLWVIAIAFAACALGGLVLTVACFAQGQPLQAVMLLGAGLLCAALAIWMVFGSVAASKGAVKLTKNCATGVKAKLIGKETAK